ncbi:MAG: nucleoside 2-deoxyribosyltransferase, partial [Verrucomicrobiales bacterium]|nr:nucleoside 2-deoxyribosyltransferase [Verrucomicrobiales bacterium]
MYFYLAAALCSEAEKAFNMRLYKFVTDLGHTAYLPQLHAGTVTDLIRTGADENAIRRKIFDSDISFLHQCDSLLILLDGRTLDEGACFELGYMHALGKPCFGFKTDPRSCIRGKDNLMIVT